MADVFNFVGKISLGKESEKFKPVDRREFQSGWMNTTVKFNCLSGTNRVPCVAQGGKWKDDKKNTIKTFSKTTTDENGNTVKGDKIEISWSKRFDEDQIDKVAGFRKFVVDTGDYRMRYKLQDAINAFAEGTITDELIEEIGVDNLDDAKEALEKSQAKRKVFLSEWDFAEFVAKLAGSNKYKDSLFNISGNYEIQYNSEKGTYYTNYHVNRITLAAEDAEPSTEMKLDFYFNEDAWHDDALEDTGKVNLNGWIRYYDSSVKKNGFKPVVIAVRESEKKLNALKRKFNVDGEDIKQIGLTVSVIEGAAMQEITIDYLDEETREDIECGLLDFEEVKKELGGRIAGDRVSEIRFAELTPKKNTVQDTDYYLTDMRAAMAEVADVDDIVENIFDDEDDL
jgi:hypothetical protein